MCNDPEEKDENGSS